MDYQLFRSHFREAVIKARDFARQLVAEPLPDAMRFRLHLNFPRCDYSLREGEFVYPEDAAYQRQKSVRNCSEDEAIAELWRDGIIPLWVDASVIGESDDATLIGLRISWRFTNNDEFLYNYGELTPFRFTSPPLPVNYKQINFEQGEKYSLYGYPQCWQASELERMRPHSHHVYYLNLLGEEFDDDLLKSLPEMPGLVALTLDFSPINGSGLSILNRFPQLRILYIKLLNEREFTFDHLAAIPGLRNLDLKGNLATPFDLDRLSQHSPQLSILTLNVSETLCLNGKLSPSIDHLKLIANHLTGNFTLPKKYKSLSLEIAQADPREIERWLTDVECVEYVGLGNGTVDQPLLMRIASLTNLKTLHLVNTGVDAELIDRIRMEYPQLTIYSQHHREL